MPDQRVPADIAAAVMERANGCCEYCRSQARYATQSFAIEHTVPRSKGGATTLANLALSCPGCNNHKYTKTTGYDPVGEQTVALYNPRQHDWDEHFIWLEDYSHIGGLTAIGRATIAELHLNRPGLVNLRRVLYLAGEHPPA